MNVVLNRLFTKVREGRVASAPSLKEALQSECPVCVKLHELYSCVPDPKISAGNGLCSNILKAKNHSGY